MGLVVNVFIRQNNTVFEDFDINLTTNFIITCFQWSPSVTKKKHVHISIINLANAYRTFNVIASKIKGRGSSEYFKELCEYLCEYVNIYIYFYLKPQKPF